MEVGARQGAGPHTPLAVCGCQGTAHENLFSPLPGDQAQAWRQRQAILPAPSSFFLGIREP